MYLKRLTVHGFKSFADRTVFEFGPSGLTCIVGPNGCGKSNVFESIRWVLGEQRPTSLRSKELTDVIFNGTVRRPPMGLCQGTLLFDNACRTLPVDAPEVEVTRRVFRSGDTEYLINGAPSRLKDVRDVFAGTGLGAGGYGFMEQGRIDQVLASNAVERRRVFEEAAGISKFRTRRRETELKLQKVEDNLTRLHDIVEEINRQIRSLKIHAGKARNHRDMTERVSALSLRFSVHRFEEIASEQERLAARLADVEAERDAASATREELRQSLKVVEGELEAVMSAVSLCQTRHAEVAGRANASRQKLEMKTAYAAEVASRLSQKRREIEELTGQTQALEEERVVVVREREALNRERERVGKERGMFEAQVADLKGLGQGLADARRKAEDYLRDLDQREAARARDAARLEAEIQHLDGRLAQIKDNRARLEVTAEDLRRGLEERTGRQGEHMTVLEERRFELTEAERHAEELESAFGSALEDLRRYEGELDRTKARSELVQGLLSKGEGLHQGTRALLEERKKSPEFLPGFRGLLLDLVDVDLERAPAVQAALGRFAEALVVANGAEVVAGLSWLRQKNLGGAHFLPLDRFAAVDPGLPEGVRASDPLVASAVGSLLAGLDVVDGEGFDARLQDPTGVTQALLVASDRGDVLRDGRLVASAEKGAAVHGLVVLRSELQDLRRRLPAAEAKCEVAKTRLEDVRNRRAACRSKIRELSVALVQQEGEAARLDQEIVRVLRELDSMKEEGERLLEEGSAAERRLQEARVGLVAMDDQRDALAADREGAATQLQEQRVREEAHAREVERALRELEQVRIEDAKGTERLESLNQQEGRLLAALADAHRRLGLDEKAVVELAQSRDDTQGVIEAETVVVAELEAEAKENAALLGERDKEAEAVRLRLKACAVELEAHEQRLSELVDRQAGHRGREGELRASMESLLERGRDELSIDLTDQDLRRQAESAVVELPSSEAGDVDWRAVDREIRELRDRIARLGNVNLAAVEELEEAEKRAEFIFRERDDLLAGKDQLRQILREIETQSTEMFLTTFRSVAEHFSAIFRKLFGGGKAEMFLEDENAPLESGIEIKARPPGKEFRSITLLSGGERTMTAVALLFAIFRANPAPCAFLDEVDAALDEDNIERFCRMLEDFTDQSQFVVVTHSKRTMSKGSLLYGVTMPERGVSRRVAVRLEEVDEEGRLRDIAAVNKVAEQTSQEESEASPVGEAPDPPEPRRSPGRDPRPPEQNREMEIEMEMEAGEGVRTRPLEAPRRARRTPPSEP